MVNKIIKICDYLQEIILLGIIFLIPVYFAFVQENYNVFELNKVAIFRILLAIAYLDFSARVFIPHLSGIPHISAAGMTGRKEIISAVSNTPLKGAGFITGISRWSFPRKLFILLALFGLSVFISTYFSIHPALSFWGSYGRQQGFYSVLHYWLFFILLVLTLRDWLRVKRVIATLIFSSILVCFYGLLQHFNLDPLDWKEKALYTGRIFSTLGQPNFLGQYLIIVIPLTVFGLIFLNQRFLSRFLTIILIIAQLACLIFTYSRSAWLGLIVSLTVFLFLFFWVKGFKKTFWVLAALLFIVIFSAISFGVFYSHRNFSLEEDMTLSGRVKSAFDIRAGSNRIRLYYWQAAWQEFKKMSPSRKLIGYGPETLADIFVKHYQPEWGIYEEINTFPDRSHNAFFDIILQFGLAGLVFFALFLGYIFVTALRYLKKSFFTKESWLVIFLLAILAGYFTNNLLSFSLTVGYVYFYLILALLAVIIFSAFPCRSGEKAREFFRPVSLILIWMAALFLAVVLIYYYNINAWRADYYYMKAKKAEVKKDCRQILDNMEKTVVLNPMSTFYKERYIYHSLNCFESTTSKESRLDLYNNVLSMANSVGPQEHGFYTWTHIAHAKSLFGYYIDPAYYQGAEEDYERLIKINPFITTTYQDLGRMKLWQKDYEAAMVSFNKAAAAFPALDSPYLNDEHKEEIKSEKVRLFEMMGLTASFKKDWEKVLNYYRQALEFNPRYLPLYKEIADVYYREGDLDSAISYNKRGYRLNPEDSAWPLAIALLYKEKGDKIEALKYAKEAEKLAPENKDIKNIINDLD